MKSSMKVGIKRLQEGPRNTKKKDDQRSLAGKTLRKLIDRLNSEIPEVMIEEETKRKQRLELKIKKKEKPSSSQEEDCLTLLSGMSLYQGNKPGDEPRQETATICQLSGLRLMEDRIKSAIHEDKVEETEEPEST